MPAASAGVLPTPGLARRRACLAYEGVLLFGITMTVGLIYGLATQQRHALAGKLGLQVLIFGVLGLYFVWFWSRTGQTLAMQTWHVRLVTRDQNQTKYSPSTPKMSICKPSLPARAWRCCVARP